MYIIFIRYILPILIVLSLQIFLSFKDNKFLGLILPFVSFAFTIILIYNAMDSIGVLVAFCIMFIPNVILFLIHIKIRKIRKIKDEEQIKLIFKDK